jgi:hypothetical protein
MMTRLSQEIFSLFRLINHKLTYICARWTLEDESTSKGMKRMFPYYKTLLLLGAATFMFDNIVFAQDDSQAPKPKKIVKVVKIIRKKTSPLENDGAKDEEEDPKPVKKAKAKKDPPVEPSEDEDAPKTKPKKKTAVIKKEEKSVLKNKKEKETQAPPEEKTKEPDVEFREEEKITPEKESKPSDNKKEESKKEENKKEDNKKEEESTEAKDETSEKQEENNREFDRYTRPQLYFSPGAPWRIVYFSPNVSYQGLVPVEGDTNMSSQDKEWCLNLKTKEPKKNCENLEFLQEVAKKCEDVQVLSCIEHASTSNWAKEKWKTRAQIVDGIQNIFHSGMEARIREFVDRGGKLPWVPTPPWCMNISPKSCSDLNQIDPRNGVNQGGKNFITSAQNCHFYEMADCTQEAINSNWAKQKWGDHPEKIRVGINEFLFENHLHRIAKHFPASMAVSTHDKK